MFDLTSVQSALRATGFDGWLLYDFRGLNVLAQRSAEVNPKLSRRWFCFIPVSGEPRKLVHAIEPGSLDHLPGSKKTVYRRWQELEAGVGALVGGPSASRWVQPTQRQPVHRPASMPAPSNS